MRACHIEFGRIFPGYDLFDKKGYVCRWPAAGSNDSPPLSQDLNLGKKRTSFTYVGLIADKPEIQAVLHQVLIAGRIDFSGREAGLIKAAMPLRFDFVRLKSKWFNTSTFI